MILLPNNIWGEIFNGNILKSTSFPYTFFPPSFTSTSFNLFSFFSFSSTSFLLHPFLFHPFLIDLLLFFLLHLILLHLIHLLFPTSFIFISSSASTSFPNFSSNSISFTYFSSTFSIRLVSPPPHSTYINIKVML